MTLPAGLPLILFGAFDRHNFGDLLFPHLMSALLPGHSCEVAGLLARDLRRFGGHRVRALSAMPQSRPAHLIHVGGEVLTCTAYQAAVMLLEQNAAAAAIARYDDDPDAAGAWAAAQLGCTRSIPYVVGRGLVAPPGRLVFNAVGGVEWATRTTSQRTEVKAALGRADWLSVRDHVTQAALRAEGIRAPLCPDPAVMVRSCFGETILRHQQQGEVLSVRQEFPQGYLACQFSADFADDVSLAAVAQGLSRVAADTGLGLVFFRAGAAPWHDDAGLYEKVLRGLPPGTARIFDSLHLWELCALIAASRGAIGSSLHGRLVALAYGLPRVSLMSPQQGPGPDKLTAFAETWEPQALPRSVAVGEIEAAALRALALPASLLQAQTARMRDACLDSLAQWA